VDNPQIGAWKRIAENWRRSRRASCATSAKSSTRPTGARAHRYRTRERTADGRAPRFVTHRGAYDGRGGCQHARPAARLAAAPGRPESGGGDADRPMVRLAPTSVAPPRSRSEVEARATLTQANGQPVLTLKDDPTAAGVGSV
jgi:hypothetical protein